MFLSCYHPLLICCISTLMQTTWSWPACHAFNIPPDCFQHVLSLLVTFLQHTPNMLSTCSQPCPNLLLACPNLLSKFSSHAFPVSTIFTQKIGMLMEWEGVFHVHKFKMAVIAKLQQGLSFEYCPKLNSHSLTLQSDYCRRMLFLLLLTFLTKYE